MKYDHQRVLTLASSFGDPRFAGTDGEAGALGRIGRELSDVGWKVVQETWIGRVPRGLSTALKSGLIGFLLANAAVGASRRSWPYFLIFMAMATRISFALSDSRRLSFFSAPTRPIHVVEGSGGDVSGKPVVMILTRVATPCGRFVGSRRRALVRGMVALSLLVETLPWLPSSGWSQSLQVTGWIFLVGGLAILGFEPFRNGGGPGSDDNRTGLALLLELARIWPKAARDRVDIRFVVVGGAREIIYQWPRDSPSLLIELSNPGLGSKIGLSATDSAYEAAFDAARDLWIPHVKIPWSAATLPPSVMVEGVREPNIPDDPASLGRVAQFVVELVLRWGKSQSGEKPSL